ncbi:MAG: tetratricopeptide repeat protein [Myxococcota bacterium]
MNPSIVLLAALSGQPAPIDGATRDELVAQAVERYGAHDLPGAIEAFERAYALGRQAADLYNIGRIYEQMGQPQRAREYYRRFLAHAELSPEERKEGKARIAALPPPPTPTPTPAPAEPETEPETESTSPRREHRRHWTVITGATLLPVGAVALLSGGVMASSALGRARSAEQSAEGEPDVDPTRALEQARRQAIASDVLLGLGGTVAVTGVAMLTAGLVRKRRAQRGGDEPTRVAVTPMGAGVRLNVRF